MHQVGTLGPTSQRPLLGLLELLTRRLVLRLCFGIYSSKFFILPHVHISLCEEALQQPRLIEVQVHLQRLPLKGLEVVAVAVSSSTLDV